MSNASQNQCAKIAWQTPRNLRTFQAVVAIENQAIAERITKLREQRGNPTQHQVAAELGVAWRTLQSWEYAEARPKYRNLERLADYYGVTENYILSGVDDRPVIQGVPEQLDGVDVKFSELVAEVMERLGEIEAKVDRLMDLVDAGLFTQSSEGVPRPGHIPEARVPLAESLREALRLLEEPAQTEPAPKTSRGA